MYKKLKDGVSKFFSIKSRTALVVVLLALACISTLDSMKKAIVISIDGKESTIVTYRKNLKGTLESQNILLGPKDKITPGIESTLKDGDRVYIKRAVKMHIFVDGRKIETNTSEETIEDALAAEGITFGPLDKIDPMPYEAPANDMKVWVTRVESKLVKEYKSIDYSTVTKRDDTLVNTVKKVVQKGQSGEKELTFKVIFENGKEVSRVIMQELVTKAPTDHVLIQGTLSTLRLSRGGVFSKNVPTDLTYKKVLRCSATAYSAEQPGIGTRTASGATVKRDPNGFSTIAVDRRIIPFGTKLYVEGYGYAIAADTGGAIKGNKIDVYFDTVKECFSWGRRSVNVYILN